MDQNNIIKNCYIRRANTIEDMKAIQILIQELANFENMPKGPKLTVQDLIRDSGLNGGKEYFHCYVAEIHQQNCPSKNELLTREIIGYAICFFSYSTWQGKSYFLEDLYVQSNYRKQGIGRLLFNEVLKKAKEYNCFRLDFHVLDWNPANEFYMKMGAKNLTKIEGWQFYRLNIS